MEFFSQKFVLGRNQAVEVSVNRAANVLLLTEINFRKYKLRESYHYYGGEALYSLIEILPPRAGSYYLVIDLGGKAGTIEHSATIVDC